uniref:Phosphatidic acid phosphatase type 2/haloperoxidase domain-containing protein n=1 Tax=Chlamydomonas leiostraca TaxID=1034604 RepID=A0A7S0WXY9_9CHLO|mmetsp:Transcript_34801/g.88165  ORF Transcript_34801/g.88165 Transcript_34801/m.88165 type:complete len:188 (+) Transcript_34801:113-676(+)
MRLLNIINQNSKWVASLVFLYGISQLGRAHACWCALGVIVLSYACKGLKHVIRQPRPPGSRKKDPGMPSNHATGIMYCAGYYAATAHDLTPLRVATHAAAVSVAAGMTWLRVYHGQHTASQVVAGAVLGGGGAVVWHAAGAAGALGVLQGHEVLRRTLYTICIAAFTNFFIKGYRKARRKLLEQKAG